MLVEVNRSLPKIGKFKVKRNEFSASQLLERDELIEQYRDYVDVVVSRLIRKMGLPSHQKDDFIAAGYLGLVEAAGKYDARKCPDFKGYAFLRIRGAIIDSIRRNCLVSGSSYRKIRALQLAHEQRMEEWEASDRAVASKSDAGAPKGAIDTLLQGATIFKLAGLLAKDELAGDVDDQDPETILELREKREKIRALVATLPEKQRTVIEHMYFQERSLSETAKEVAGLSKSWVSRIHDKALETLRDKLEEMAREESG
jgi:RNA polymerase sigma factor for flagellar operon FliA